MRKYLMMMVGVIVAMGSILLAQDDMFQSLTTIGGYGEMHYNYEKKENVDATKILDFHRFVLFVSHTWSDKWSFNSEVELEHNFVHDGDGELELEQAYVDYNHSELFNFKAGVILPSSGIINEEHEPTTFFTVERPDYAKYIIPTTWFGNGAGLHGYYKDFEYNVNVMEGLNAANFSAKSGIRNGREKGYKSNAEKLLYNGSLTYTGIPNLKLGTSFTTNDAVLSDSTNNKINLFEVHARYNHNNFYATFEAGNISFDNSEVETARGFYFNLGYNIGNLLGSDSKIIPFVQWSDINTAHSTNTGGNSEKENHYKKWLVGITFKKIDNVAFKFDFGKKENVLTESKTTILNLGMGYLF